MLTKWAVVGRSGLHDEMVEEFRFPIEFTRSHDLPLNDEPGVGLIRH
jgi:hypothetical protein